jgi:hypothetical protein
VEGVQGVETLESVVNLVMRLKKIATNVVSTHQSIASSRTLSRCAVSKPVVDKVQNEEDRQTVDCRPNMPEVHRSEHAAATNAGAAVENKSAIPHDLDSNSIGASW